MKLVWTARASANLEEIADYIASDSPRAAGRVAQHIVLSVARLRAQPFLGKPGRVPGTRELVIARSPYVAAYRIKDERIEVLAVRHGAREWPKHL